MNNELFVRNESPTSVYRPVIEISEPLLVSGDVAWFQLQCGTGIKLDEIINGTYEKSKEGVPRC